MKITPPSPHPLSIHQCSLLTSAGRVFDFVDNHQFRIREPLVLSFGGVVKKKNQNQRTAGTLNISDRKEPMWLVSRTVVNISEWVL
jgi:hypothetical protein